jgi:hypothetical protein
VNIAASAETGVTGCSDSKTNTTSVTVNKLPVLTVDVVGSDFAVCSTDDSYSLSYSVNTGASGLPFAVYTADVCFLADANGAAVNQSTQGMWRGTGYLTLTQSQCINVKQQLIVLQYRMITHVGSCHDSALCVSCYVCIHL